MGRDRIGGRSGPGDEVDGGGGQLGADVLLDEVGRLVEGPVVQAGRARDLVEEGGAMIVGADNLSFEAFPSEVEGNYVPLHTYLLAQTGTPIIELAYLEDLSRDQVYEFAFIGGSLKLRGSDAAPLRPIAIPLRREWRN